MRCCSIRAGLSCYRRRWHPSSIGQRDLRRLEWHGRILGRRTGSDPLDEARGDRPHPDLGGLPAARTRRGPDLQAYLALHDIHAEIATFRPIDKSVGAGLLAAAREFGADLLSMGAYSHSRLRQLILGGVTRHILENADLPVLMSRYRDQTPTSR